MANRTYAPTLRVLTQAILKFCARYRVQIVKNLTAPQVALLDVLLDAAAALAASLGAAPVGD